MEKIVLDTYAVISFFYNEKGAEKVEEILLHAKEKNIPVFMSAVNCSELFGVILKKTGVDAAIRAMDILDTIPVEIIDIDRNIALLAGSFKVVKKMSFADCFSAAIAQIYKATLVTGDKEFRAVEKEIRIIWI